MTPYSPTSRTDRAALALVGTVLSLSLMSGVLSLFSDERVPAIRQAAAAAGRVPHCTASNTAADRCVAPTTKAVAPTASSVRVAQQLPKNELPVRVALEQERSSPSEGP